MLLGIRLKLRRKNANMVDVNLFYKSIKFVSTIIWKAFIIVMYESISNLRVAITYGYHSIYYGSEKDFFESIFKYISYMFLPSLIGFLIGNKYSKKSFFIISVLFAIYMLVNVLSGDRGSWIYSLATLIWAYIYFIKNHV